MAAQTEPEAALDALRTRAAAVADLPEAERVDAYRGIRDGLDRIIAEYPESDLAVDILLRRSLPGLDLSTIYAVLRNDRDTRIATRRAAAPTTPASSKPAPPEAAEQTIGTGDAIAVLPNFFPTPEPGTPLPSSEALATQGEIPGNLTGGRNIFPSLTAGTEATEAALGMDRQTIRDLQARLLVSGHDPNGVDGQIGRGTRGALRAWQTSEGIEPTGYLTSEQLARLRTQSQSALDIWLQDPGNSRRHTPPAPIALTPRRIAGTWNFTSRCGGNSRLGRITIRGVLSVVHAGGDRYVGRAQQSQGFRGDFTGQLRGRTLEGAINWGLLVGRTGFRGQVADQNMTISGSDTNRCAFSARKR